MLVGGKMVLPAKIFEINPRCSSSTVMRAFYGFNEPEMALRTMVLEEKVTPRPLSTGIALRMWDEIYIDPLTDKNKPLGREESNQQLRVACIPTDKPFITQVSRMDPWKDPEGVLEVFRLVREEVDCRLVFCSRL